MIRVNVKAPGLTKLAAKASRAANLLGGTGLRQVLQDAGEDLVKEFQENIEAMTPGRVPDLKPETKKRKMKEVGFIYPILKRTASMYNSMKIRVLAPTGQGWTLQLMMPGSDSKGNPNRDKAQGHLTGAGHLPKRDFTTISRKWRDNLLEQIRAARRRGQ